MDAIVTEIGNRTVIYENLYEEHCLENETLDEFCMRHFNTTTPNVFHWSDFCKANNKSKAFYSDDYPITMTSDYEYGLQKKPDSRDLYYYRFYDMLVIDFDDDDDDDEQKKKEKKKKTFDDIETILRPFDVFCWVIAQTTKGFHAYLVSRALPFYEQEAMQMQLLGDETYAKYCFKYGYKVRVSKKYDDEELVKGMRFYGDETKKCARYMNFVTKIRRAKEFYSKQQEGELVDEPKTIGDEKFFKSFIDMCNRNAYYHEYGRVVRQYIQKKYSAQHELLVPFTIQSMRKPQRLVYDADDYYIALDIMTHTYYMCFRTLLMVDIDQKELPELPTNNGELWEVHETRRGYHVFALHKPYTYGSKEAMDLMLQMNCDVHYANYSALRGWSVRLNRKKGDGEMLPFKFHSYVGCGDHEPQLLGYVRILMEMMKSVTLTEGTVYY